MIQFFDTETTGLPKNWKAPVNEVENWPRVIQLAWTVCDMDGKVLKLKEHLIKPDGWVIPVEKFWIDHGFSTEKSLQHGIPIQDAIDDFCADLSECEFIVSHNMDFDHKVLGAEMLRAEKSGKRCVKICTKEASTDFCKIPFPGRKDTRSWVKQNYKWPKLEELYKFLFNSDFDNKHQAGGDVAALRLCFFELVRRGVISIN